EASGDAHGLPEPGREDRPTGELGRADGGRGGGGGIGEGLAKRGAAAAAEHFGELQLGGDAARDIAVRAGDPGGSPILVLGLLIGEKLAGAAAGPHGPGVGGTVGSKIARLAVVVG